jgi:rod shape-determining protein MreB
MRTPFRKTWYLKLTPELFSLLDVQSGMLLSEQPLLAYKTDKGRRIPLAAGNAALGCAGQAGVTLANGFRHPRTLLADFSIAAATLKLLLQKCAKPFHLQLAPTLILHPQAMLEGGLTQIEIRGLVELARSAGARKIFLWTGPELPAATLGTLDFGSARGQLLYPEQQ